MHDKHIKKLVSEKSLTDLLKELKEAVTVGIPMEEVERLAKIVPLEESLISLHSKETAEVKLVDVGSVFSASSSPVFFSVKQTPLSLQK